MDAHYRRYGHWVPTYLYNCPHSLVKDCLIKKDIAENMDLSGVIMIKTAIKYFVSFGDDITIPKCTCIDWMSTAYPCKHFFLVLLFSENTLLGHGVDWMSTAYPCKHFFLVLLFSENTLLGHGVCCHHCISIHHT